MSTSDDHGRGAHGVALCPVLVSFNDPQRLQGPGWMQSPSSSELGGSLGCSFEYGCNPFPGVGEARRSHAARLRRTRAPRVQG